MSTAIEKMGLPLLLLSGLLLWSCGNNQNPPVEHNRAKPPVPPLHLVYYDYAPPPEPYFSKAQAVVLKKYGLSHEGFGCVVTDSLIRAVHQHNDSLFVRLRPAFPGFSEARLLQEMQDYITTQSATGNAR